MFFVFLSLLTKLSFSDPVINGTELTILDTKFPENITDIIKTNKITRVVINGPSFVPAYAFLDCTTIQSVYLGDLIQNISQCAFQGCSSFREQL